MVSLVTSVGSQRVWHRDITLVREDHLRFVSFLTDAEARLCVICLQAVHAMPHKFEVRFNMIQIAKINLQGS